MTITVADLNLGVARLSRFLPKQGPIGVFIHHNTLQGFEDKTFHEAVCEVASQKKAHVYMQPEFYGRCFTAGRINADDLEQAAPAGLKALMTELVASLPSDVMWQEAQALGSAPKSASWQEGSSPHAFSQNLSRQQVLLQHFLLQSFDRESQHTVSWRINHGLADRVSSRQLEVFQQRSHQASARSALPTGYEAATDLYLDEQALVDGGRLGALQAVTRAYLNDLWQQVAGRAAASAVYAGKGSALPAAVEPNQGFATAALTRTNALTYEFLTRYFDRGLSSWPMPKNDEGLVSAFLASYAHEDARLPAFFRALAFKPQQLHAASPDDLILTLLAHLRVPKASLEDFLFGLMEGVEGWGALVHYYEKKAQGRVHVKDLLALRLFIFCSLQGCYQACPSKTTCPDLLTTSYQVFDLLLAAGCDGADVARLPAALWQKLWDASTDFDGLERQKILHAAYEYHYYKKVGMALIRRGQEASHTPKGAAHFSAVFCIDDREESMRRHLEEVDPQCLTYGYAGFFNIDMLYKGVGEPAPTALCPVAITPVKLVEEQLVAKVGIGSHLAVMLKAMQRFLHVQSRTMTTGALVHTFMAVFVVVADLIKLVSPRLFLTTRRAFDQWAHRTIATKVALTDPEREAAPASSYSYDELAERVAGLLKTVGMDQAWTPLIFIVGHGSSSLNNPHKSAYNCGACSGQRGAPNARVFAAAANHPLVRQRLAADGIVIPAGVWFVGGIHDTCSEELVFFDLDDIPASLKEAFASCRATFAHACQRDAEERARRFHSVPFAGPRQALQAVQSRAWSYGQPRPECGHATNALCIVGRRSMTQGLFLDRRAFLCSYDPTSDDGGDTLAGLITAVIPVCVGINLEYYFSYVDNETFGCGTKLPHNPTGLVGVMNGGLSDLQTGLPWQMVEIHEPVRLLMIVECSLAKFKSLRSRIPHVFDLVERGWMYLALFEPGSQALTYLNGDILAAATQGSSVPRRGSSQDYIAGQRLHLDPCLIG